MARLAGGPDALLLGGLFTFQITMDPKAPGSKSADRHYGAAAADPTFSELKASRERKTAAPTVAF